MPQRELKSAEIAMLRQGKERALTTALLDLESRGGLSVDTSERPARFLAVSGFQAEDPLEKEILAQSSASTTLTNLRRAPGIQSRLEDMLQDLAARNWILAPARVVRVMTTAQLLWVALCALGGIRLVIGLANGRPIVYLFCEVFIVFILGANSLSKSPRLPAHSESHLAGLGRDHSAWNSPPAPTRVTCVARTKHWLWRFLEWGH